MKVKPIIDPDRLQEIVSHRETIIRDVIKKVVRELENMPAGYGVTVEAFKRQAISRIEAITNALE